jgi:carbon storage regulator CsrA
MLVLSRKLGEMIHIGENISVEVRRVAGNRVTLAIEAPREIRILRGELKVATEAFQEPVVMDAVATGPVVTGPVATGPVATGPVATGSGQDYFVTHHRVSMADNPCSTI